MSLHLIDVISQIHVKEIKLLSELYQKILNEFSCIIKPENEKLAMLLYCKCSEFEYPIESPLYYILCDKVDELKSKFPNLDINKRIKDITPLDCAIKYGSELCFNYLKNLGAEYTDNSEKYAGQGGNNSIFMQMIEEGKSFGDMINTALDYRNYEIAEYLKSNLGQFPNSITECMHFGNFDVASYLITNGEDINKLYNLFIFIIIIVLYNSISTHIYHRFIQFSFFSY